MKPKPPYGYWNIKQNVIDDAKRYKKRADWKKYSPGAYQSARRNNWLDECREHIKSMFSVEYGYWKNKKRVIADARKYITRSQWVRNSSAAYQSARKHGWLEISCKHMMPKVDKWLIKQNVIDDSKKYETRAEWILKSGGAYQAAVRSGWLGECYAHKGARISRDESIK